MVKTVMSRPPDLKHVDCPLCQDGRWLKRLMRANRRVLDGGGRFHYYRDPHTFMVICQRCGLVFESPVYPDDYYRSLFSTSYYSNPRGYETTDLEKLDRRLPILARHTESGVRSILEIGSSSGACLHGLKQHFQAELCVGIEPSTEYASYSRERWPDLSIVNCRWEDYTADRAFDLLIAGFCVGHFTDPLSSFSKLYEVLEPGGILYIDDGANPLCAERDSRNRRLEHLLSHEKRFYYTETTLAQVLGRTGFSVIEMGGVDMGLSYPAMFFVCRRQPVAPDAVQSEQTPASRQHADAVEASLRRARMTIIFRMLHDDVRALPKLGGRVGRRIVRRLARSLVRRSS